MNSKSEEKKQAIALRKEGKTYSEILKVVPVSKSTLSLWLREVHLTKNQKQKLTLKKRSAQKRGGARKREIRLQETEEIYKRCKKDIKNITDRELFLMGIVLYWAEGAKKNANKPSVLVDFGNSDPAMLQLFVSWLLKFGDVAKEDIVLRLQLHETYRHAEAKIKAHWSQLLDIPLSQFSQTNFKKHNPKTVRYKTGSDYIGLVSVRVKKSTRLNRYILGWIYAIIATQN